MSRKRPRDIEEMQSNIPVDNTNKNGASSSREESPSFPVICQ